jgi:hypothetical protein
MHVRKKLLMTIAAAAALAVPAAALADHGGGSASRLLAVGSGSMTSGTITRGKPFATGAYAASIAASGTAETKRGFSCASATGTVTLSTSGAALPQTVTGKLCTATTSDARIKSMFLGRFTVGTPTGTAAAALAGARGIVGLAQKADGTVRFFEAGGKRAAVREWRQGGGLRPPHR